MGYQISRWLRWRALTILPGFLLLTACFWGEQQPMYTLSGHTMGTRYQVMLTPQDKARLPELKTLIQSALDDIDARLSTYKPDSELSRFNRAAPGQWFAMSSTMQEVIELALDIYNKTQSAFDVTVGPLVNLWGFGPGPDNRTVPDKQSIQDALNQVGSRYLHLGERGIMKTRPLYVDLSAIAKGYAVDKVADALDKQGIASYLVEVGGEVRAKGLNATGEGWRLGIENPDNQSQGIHARFNASGKGVATSGNYRNYFTYQGVEYAHTIDPSSGWPVKHQLLSVTVVSNSCAKADAYATALMVLGPDKARQIANRQQLAVYLVEKSAGGWSGWASESFKPLLLP